MHCNSQGTTGTVFNDFYEIVIYGTYRTGTGTLTWNLAQFTLRKTVCFKTTLQYTDSETMEADIFRAGKSKYFKFFLSIK